MTIGDNVTDSETVKSTEDEIKDPRPLCKICQAPLRKNNKLTTKIGGSFYRCTECPIKTAANDNETTENNIQQNDPNNVGDNQLDSIKTIMTKLSLMDETLNEIKMRDSARAKTLADENTESIRSDLLSSLKIQLGVSKTKIPKRGSLISL